MSKLRHLAITIKISFIIGLFCVGCSKDWETPLPYQGTIVAVRHGAELYVPATNLNKKLWPFNILPSVFVSCKGPGDTLIAVGHSANGDLTDPALSGHPVFKYSPMNNQISPVESLGDSSYYCSMIDYDRASNRYLFAGWYASQPGIFILDSSFALIQDCNDFVFENGDSAGNDVSDRVSARAYFLSPERLLVSKRDETVVVDLKSGTRQRIGPRMKIIAISHDRTKVAEYIDESYFRGRAELIVRDALTGQELEHISGLHRPYHGCFSPDDRVLAFTQIEGFMDIARIWMYDFDTEELYRSEVTFKGGTSLVWIEQEASSHLPLGF